MAKIETFEQVAGGLLPQNNADSSDKYRFSDSVVQITSEKELGELLSHETPALLFILVHWCPQCRAVFPIFDKVAQKNPGLTLATLEQDLKIGHDLFEGHHMKFPTFVLVGQNKPPEILGSLGEVRTYEDMFDSYVKKVLTQSGGRRRSLSGRSRNRKRRKSMRRRRKIQKSRKTRRRRQTRSRKN